MLRDVPRVPVSCRRGGDEAFQRLESVQLYLALRSQGCDPGPLLSAAWAQFYEVEAPCLLRLARDYSRLGADPRDGAQAAWQAILTRLPAFQLDPEQGSFHAWLMTVARHVLIDQERHEHRHPSASLDAAEADHLPSPDPGPALACEVRQLRELVRAALAELRSYVSETSYQVLYQHWIEARSFAEIARDLGLTSTQVRDRHDRMLRQLRPILLRHLGGRLPWEKT